MTADQTPQPQPRAKPARLPVEPLATRHVFLDTEVYRKLQHNPANRAMGLLREQIEAHRIVLHATDVTLLEVKRQIRERVIAHDRELGSIEKSLVQWRKASTQNAPGKPLRINVDALASDLFDGFDRFLRRDCQATVHRALEIPAAAIFDTYFARLPPFHGEGSKEFPDAFALEALSRWCSAQGERIYIVTEDVAMRRTANDHPSFLTLPDLHQVLAAAAADLGAEGETAAEEALNGQDFDGSFELQMVNQIGEVAFVYVGDMADGEAYGGELVSVEAISDWSVVGLSDDRVTLILTVDVKAKVEIQYEDREDAIYDKEDGVWFGAESGSTHVEEEVQLEVLADVARATGAVRDAKVLTPEVSIYGPSDDDY